MRARSAGAGVAGRHVAVGGRSLVHFSPIHIDAEARRAIETKSGIAEVPQK